MIPIRERIGRVADFPEGEGQRVEVKGKKVAVFRVGEELYAIGAVCPHQQGPLDEGEVTDFQVECPWHASRFDLRTGEVTGPPAHEGVPIYKVMVDGDDVLLDV